MSHIADPSLAPQGHSRIDWAAGQMPVIRQITERFAKERPFDGIGIAACLHVTTETANLVRALVAGGAEVGVCGSNPLSTQDDVAAALADDGVNINAVRGEDNETYYSHIDAVLDANPHLTVDDGADLVSTIHLKRPEQAASTLAGTEETTTGVIRLRQMAADNALRYPIVAINDTPTKHLFDNRFGTGQSAIDGIIRATNFLLAGRTAVVAGFGNCGRGVADRLRGHGAHVIVTEIDPVRAIEAVMDGFRVMPMEEALPQADVICTVTGNRDVITRDHLKLMKDGVLLANAGHFDIEIDVAGIRAASSDIQTPRASVEEITTADGRRVRLLAEGRLVNLGAAEGHPAAVMDMSFAGQALALEWLARKAADGTLPEPQVLDVPRSIDDDISTAKLASMGVKIDTLTAAQSEYLSSWTVGT